jgi:predicted acetyltransferase
MDPQVLHAYRPQDGDLLLEFSQTTPFSPQSIPSHHFRLVHTSGENMGYICLREGSTKHIEQHAGHIGYAVDPPHQGHRYAARAIRLLLPLARELGFETIWITCDPSNTASRRTCELAGAEFIEIVEIPSVHIRPLMLHQRKCRYQLTL